MPTYDYRCPNGHDFERFVRKISEAASELECPVCGALAHRRVSGGAGLVFKGSGFYLTDYGKNAHRKSGPDASGGESKSEPGSASSTDGAKPGSGSTGESSGTAKSETPPAAKSDSAKSTEAKPSGQPKRTGGSGGGDAK